MLEDVPAVVSVLAMIQFSQSALREIKRLQAKEPYEGGFVRLAIAAGGCSGLMYHLSFAVKAQPEDHILAIAAMPVLLSPETLALCDGMVVDYSEDLMGGNFRFTNPAAKQTCGCGVSFSTEAAAPQTVEDCASTEP